MTAILKQTVYNFLYIFVDKYSFLDIRKVNVVNLIFNGIKFKLAKKGIYLTKEIKTLSNLKDKYKGKRCFIIGNGPSLNKIDLTKLKNEYTFGVNAIYLNYDRIQFHPNFYVVEDYLVAEDRAKEINAYKGPDYKFFGTYLNYVLEKDDKTILLNVLINKYVEPFIPHFSKECDKWVGIGGTVTFVCLQLAYYLGFDEVYMVGFDHNYKVPKDADLEKSTVILSKEDDNNHFSKEYFGKGYRWHDPKVDRMENCYYKAREVYEKDKRKIYNATVGGHLEVFDRVDYNSLF